MKKSVQLPLLEAEMDKLVAEKEVLIDTIKEYSSNVHELEIELIKELNIVKNDVNINNLKINALFVFLTGIIGLGFAIIVELSPSLLK